EVCATLEFGDDLAGPGAHEVRQPRVLGRYAAQLAVVLAQNARALCRIPAGRGELEVALRDAPTHAQRPGAVAESRAESQRRAPAHAAHRAGRGAQQQRLEPVRAHAEPATRRAVQRGP